MPKGNDDEIDDDAADRIMDTIDTEGDWYDVRKQLVKRYSKWSAHQRDRMATKIINRKIELDDFEKGKPSRSYTKIAKDKATGPGGTKKARYKVVRTIDGKYLGRPANVRITTRKGSKVYGKNLKTGSKGRIK